jgi:hypothetical protein
MGVETGKQLVIVGDGSDALAYWKSLQALAAGDLRVRLVGPVYGEGIRASCSRTPTSTCSPPRSKAPRSRWWRRWGTGTASW